MEFAYDLTAAFRALAFLNVLLLLLMYVIIRAARKRQERVERKVDRIAWALARLARGLKIELDLEDDFTAIDKEYGRESGMAQLE